MVDMSIFADQSFPCVRVMVIAAFFGLGGVAGSSIAQTAVYRCVDGDGTTVFSNVPCADEPEIHVIEESYRSDPANPARPQAPMPSPSERGSARQTMQQEPQMAAPAGPASLPEPMATRCTSQDGRRVYYTLGGCGRSGVSATGTLVTTGEPVIGHVRLADQAEPAPFSDACSWARGKANNTRNSSDERRSARSLMNTVCR